MPVKRIDLRNVDPTLVVDLDAGGVYDPGKYCVGSGVVLDSTGARVNWKKELPTPANFVEADLATVALDETDPARERIVWYDKTNNVLRWSDGGSLAIPVPGTYIASVDIKYDDTGNMYLAVGEVNTNEGYIYKVSPSRQILASRSDIRSWTGATYGRPLSVFERGGVLYGISLDKIFKLNASDLSSIAYASGPFRGIVWYVDDQYIYTRHPWGVYIYKVDDLSGVGYYAQGGYYSAGVYFVNGVPVHFDSPYFSYYYWHTVSQMEVCGHENFNALGGTYKEKWNILRFTRNGDFMIAYVRDKDNGARKFYRADLRHGKRLILPVFSASDPVPDRIYLRGTLTHQTRLYWRPGSAAQTDPDTGWQPVDPEDPSSIITDPQGWQLAIYLAHVPWLKGPDGVLIPHSSGSMESPVVEALDLFTEFSGPVQKTILVQARGKVRLKQGGA